MRELTNKAIRTEVAEVVLTLTDGTEDYLFRLPFGNAIPFISMLQSAVQKIHVFDPVPSPGMWPATSFMFGHLADGTSTLRIMMHEYLFVDFCFQNTPETKEKFAQLSALAKERGILLDGFEVKAPTRQ